MGSFPLLGIGRDHSEARDESWKVPLPENLTSPKGHNVICVPCIHAWYFKVSPSPVAGEAVELKEEYTTAILLNQQNKIGKDFKKNISSLVFFFYCDY